jgi:hypothetical protein
MNGQAQLSGSDARCILRRQVSDLGMEDPVAASSSQGRKASKERDLNDGDSAVSTFGGMGDEHFPSEETGGVDVVSNDEELELEDLISTGPRSLMTRSTSSGSSALRAMSDSFNSSVLFNEDSLTEDVSEERNEEPIRQRVGRSLPRRTGSGYVRGDGSPRSNSAGNTRRSLRASNTKASNGLAVSVAALREKRRGNISVTQQIEVRQRSGRSDGAEEQ